MRVLGTGGRLWLVAVVLRTPTRSEDLEEQLVEATDAALDGEVDDDAVVKGPAVKATTSFDMPPPDGTVGVEFWVRANTVGAAVDYAWLVVRDAAGALLREFSLYGISASFPGRPSGSSTRANHPGRNTEAGGSRSGTYRGGEDVVCDLPASPMLFCIR